jgi:DNA-binding NarL/FixJ family response regulator
MTISVLLVDDHALIRQGVRRAFEQTEDLTVVAEATCVAEALALDRTHAPRVVVVDLSLGDGSGLEVVRHVRSQRPATGVVVLTMHDGDDQLLAALEAGASSFVLKQAPVSDVVDAARHASVSPTTFTADGLAAAMKRRLAKPAVQLSTREREILALLAEGLSVAEVSGRLYVSASTTKSHMAKLYDKLGASNRTQAVMNAVRLGLITVDGDCQ